MDARRVRFAAQVLPHLDSAYRFARWLTRSPADAEDLVQESVLRAWRGLEGLRGTDVRAWLFAIVRNCHATLHRQSARHASVPLPGEHATEDDLALASTDPDPETLAVMSDEERQFNRLLAGLSAEHREVLALRELEEMSYREIADITRIPIGTVMSRLARAREALRELWLKEGEGELRGVR